MVRSASQILAKPAPKLSRRCPVTRTSRLLGSSQENVGIEVLLQGAWPSDSLANPEQRVDDGIAGYDDRLGVVAFLQKRFARAPRRRVMARGNHGRQPAIGLLRPWT